MVFSLLADSQLIDFIMPIKKAPKFANWNWSALLKNSSNFMILRR